MYEELFQSSDRPFRATPDTKYYYAHESIEAARQTTVRAMTRAEGPVMVLGGAGLGKSLLGQLIAGDLAPSFDIVKLHAARLCSRRALLQSMLFELNMPYRQLSEGELRLSILDRLEPSADNAPDGILIIVDEAHTLPAKLLDELRLITNFTRQGQPRARLVLIGSLRLEDIFAHPHMESFNQRLAARCYLQQMNRQQTAQFVRHQISVAGIAPERLVTADALNTVYAASEGVPRLVNQLMDHAFVLATSHHQCPLSAPLIEEAWADLQQLPAPWHSGINENPHATSASNVEFGVLDSDDDDETSVDLETPMIDEQPSEADLSEVSWREVSQEVSQEALPETRPYSPQPGEEPNELANDNPPLQLIHDKGSWNQPALPAVARTSATVREESAAEPQCDSCHQAPVPAQSNFFAAFSPPDEEADAADEESLSAIRATPQVASTAWAVEDDRECEPSSNAECRQTFDSFFLDRPTDEKMLALADEQSQYDSMGVWENDPPLTMHEEENAFSSLREEAVGIPESSTPTTPAPTNQRPIVKTINPRDLFGDDFEDELYLPDHFSTGTVQPVIDVGFSEQRVESLPEAAQAAAVTEYLTRIQEFADAIQDEQATVVGDEAAASCPAIQSEAISQAPHRAKEQAWSLDVASVDAENEIAVHSEIEDLVSQLNFAAFSVEPFSVEQINLDASQEQKRRIAEDSVRSGANQEIYTLHRSQSLDEGNLFTEISASYDDDRDMLVVEEDIAVPAAAAQKGEGEGSPIKLAPYSQLFAKLRK